MEQGSCWSAVCDGPRCAACVDSLLWTGGPAARGRCGSEQWSVLLRLQCPGLCAHGTLAVLATATLHTQAAWLGGVERPDRRNALVRWTQRSSERADLDADPVGLPP
jgi:hypothetical protein